VAKVTSKLQVTVPEAVAAQYGIRPGDEIEWVPAGDGIRVVPARRDARASDLAWRLEVFDAATERQRLRQSPARPARARQRSRRAGKPGRAAGAGRGWTREELDDRARPR
jgi:bifunctional DNA-binding transcriptional regulator/antitoxin component of YhaV-PrlF toxin-antitoxin module